ncbi:MAG TPA: hypothetical protein VFQ80_17420 [Thermomicrobiales bacterium]|jgi:hypothetical protein|nr:hypothetical protein [Thermomicrobiales bacterium]
MSTMRFTIVDGAGTTSFVAPPHALKMLTAACSKGAADHIELLREAEAFDPILFGQVIAGLTGAEGSADRRCDGEDAAFRVVDEATKHRSLEPARYGLVVFNLSARRIVQVQNSYHDLLRADRGRLRRDGRPVRAYYRYALPDDWSIVP